MSDRHTRRDTAFDRTLARGLGRQPDPSDGCPDPEIIAAFWDHSLPPVERRTCEDHVSRCSRCQAQLAALVRTAPIGDGAPATEPSGLHWLLDWRWLTPLAAAAAVLLAVWVIEPDSVTEQTAPTTSDASRVEIADDRQPEAELSASLRERSDLQVAARENAQLESDAPVVVDEVSPTNRVVPATAAAQPGVGGAALPTISEVAAEEPTERRLSVQSVDSRNTASPLRAEAFEDAGATVVISPDPDTRWRFSDDTVDFTRNGGATWSRQLTGIGTSVSAGSAPSATVCWIVGQAGTVFRTVNGGESWEQVGAPTEADLADVEALDGQSATVVAIDATSFRTEDGGQSWTPAE